MDELEISGKRYISAKRAGKENKYHPDYIGQLIRGGKVIGQKVGRSWYVDAESLATYLSGDAKPVVQMVGPVPVVVEPTPEPAPAPQQVVQKEEPVAETAPVIETPALVEIEKESQSSVEEHRIPVRAIQREEKKGGLTYVSDDEPLLPEITKVTERAVELQRMEEPEVVYEERVHVPRTSHTRTTAALASVALGVFFVVAGLSYFVHYTATIEGEQNTASISLGL